MEHMEVTIMQSFLTRNDDGFDSIAWAYEVHVKQADPFQYHYAILTGNEDAPERIEFYTENDFHSYRWVWVPA